MMNKAIFATVFSIACLTAFPATITGTVSDRIGSPIPGVIVTLFQDVKTSEAVTSPLGAFVFPGANSTQGGIIRVDWRFPAGDSRIKDNHIIFKGIKITPDPSIPPTSIIDYTSADKTFSRTDFVAGTAVVNLTMANSLVPYQMAMIRHVQQFVAMVYSKRQGTTWSINYDIPIYEVFPTTTSFADPTEYSINITAGSATAVPSDIYHEMGHLIQQRIYRQNTPAGTHFFDEVQNPLLAFSEGWADYLGALAFSVYPLVDRKYDLVLEGSPGHLNVWRGLKSLPPHPIANDGTDNNGEVIENNVASLLIQAPRLGFGDYIRVLQKAKPQVYRDFFFGVTQLPKPRTLFDDWATHCEKLGVVYSRLQFQDDKPFYAEAPAPNDLKNGPNARKLRGTWHVRGFISANLLPLSAAELNATTADVPDQAVVIFKGANPGSGESAQPLARWKTDNGSSVGLVDGFFRPTWSTRQIPDGPYDLVAQAHSLFVHWDSLFPDFTGDSNVVGDNTDERWLKHIGTWLSTVRDHPDDAAGRVNVDNTPPRVVPGSFSPPPNK